LFKRNIPAGHETRRDQNQKLEPEVRRAGQFPDWHSPTDVLEVQWRYQHSVQNVFKHKRGTAGKARTNWRQAFQTLGEVLASIKSSTELFYGLGA
jgi:hypothetical protein